MYECTILTRGYEVAARGVIPPSAFARYLEHVRWQGFLNGPAAMRAIMAEAPRAVIRAQRFELYQDVGHHVPLRFSTWISRVGRSSVDFAHRIWREAKTAGEEPTLIGLAAATVVALGLDGRPMALPDVVRAAVVEDVLPKALPVDEAVPANASSHPLQIRPSDIDLLQHVNQSNYVSYFDDVRLMAAAAGAYGTASAAAAAPVAAVAIDHRREARLGQEVVGRTWLADALPTNDAGSVLGFALQDTANGDVLCRGRIAVAPRA